ncbi:hypothetical protein INT80_13400 [Gallibacterium anatis]|uniref:Uncharacterized protein n=1 Tax=Gallibacterium anatis TaxID=750 RepID=A0A930YAW6_9PAST|nr:hypothetical protein [Gallibacterium anatis]
MKKERRNEENRGRGKKKVAKAKKTIVMRSLPNEREANRRNNQQQNAKKVKKPIVRRIATRLY